MALDMQPEDVVVLPLDELALRVLADARRTNAWNWKNWMNGAQQAMGRDLAALQALSEAWTWLRAKGLIAWNPQQDSERVEKAG